MYSIFLIGALVPSNLLRFERYASGRRTRALARLRKPLGISAGVWFVAHSVVSVWEFFDLSLPLLPQFTRTGVVLGILETVVFVAMLATSTDRAQRALGRNWKRLHRLVWFAVPLALAHTILASGWNSPSIVILLGDHGFRRVRVPYPTRTQNAGGVDTPEAISAGVFAAALIYVVL